MDINEEEMKGEMKMVMLIVWVINELRPKTTLHLEGITIENLKKMQDFINGPDYTIPFVIDLIIGGIFVIWAAYGLIMEYKKEKKETT